MADTTNRVAGIATVNVDGTNYLLKGDLEIKFGTIKRETIVGQDQPHGYSEMPDVPYIKGTFTYTSGLSVSDFNAMTNVTVNCQLANGVTASGANMWTVGEQIVKTTEGSFEVEFNGFNVLET